MDTQPTSGTRLRSGQLLGARARTARVGFKEPPAQSKLQQRISKQRERILLFQHRWKNIKEDLPPQLTRRHIGMISIGGVIGTGLFLGSADALANGGPLGAFLGYSIIGSVVYCLCVSIGEIIAFLPNVGGVVGVADLYVDPALGFSLGWSAWYNWSVTLPAEITAAAVVATFWTTKAPVAALIGIFVGNISYIVAYLHLIVCKLAIATGINCFPSRVYGEVEFWLSSLKVFTIIFMILISLLIDVGIGNEGVIGFKYWKDPGPFAQYLNIPGSKGRFLGFFAVLMQASFAFFGSEVPGIAAGEVIDATRNVPRALQRVWIRITLFYLGGIFCAGLLVPSSDTRLLNNQETGKSSPFVIALYNAKIAVIPDFINAAILVSAWSAAASDIYISSRFLFFLARQGHAPSFLKNLVRYPHVDMPDRNEPIESDVELSDTEDHVLWIRPNGSVEQRITPTDTPSAQPFISDEVPVRDHPNALTPKPTYVLPLACVLTSASVGLFGFLSVTPGGADQAFEWIVAVASVASLQSWTGMLYTYIRWHQGTIFAENREYHDDAEKETVMKQITRIKRHRHRGQPYLAWYAFSVCIIVLATNGFNVFLHHGWKLAETPDNLGTAGPQIANFLSSYIPIPVFILLTVGYKLIYRTKMVELEEMDFSRGEVPDLEPDDEVHGGWWNKFVSWVTVN